MKKNKKNPKFVYPSKEKKYIKLYKKKVRVLYLEFLGLFKMICNSMVLPEVLEYWKIV